MIKNFKYAYFANIILNPKINYFFIFFYNKIKTKLRQHRLI